MAAAAFLAAGCQHSSPPAAAPTEAIVVAVTTASVIPTPRPVPPSVPAGDVPGGNLAGVASEAANRPSASAPPADWKSVYDQVSSGVVRIDALSCDTGGTGTGFLIGPDLVATVAHAVEGFPLVRVTDPTLERSVAGQVIGVDHQHDLALIRLPLPFPGHVFVLSAAAPSIATEMAAIGFPLGGAMQATFGHITNTQVRRTVQDGSAVLALSDVALSDAALNHGNSGGPWLTRDGTVVALDESGPPSDQDNNQAQGNNGGIPTKDAAPFFAAWESTPVAPPATDCSAQMAAYTPAQQAYLSLFNYFNDLNASDYASAYAQLDPADHPASDEASFEASVQSSHDVSAVDPSKWFDWVGQATDKNSPLLDVHFRSTQDAALGRDGQTCTDWQLQYRFVQVGGLWLIRSSDSIPGTAGPAACPTAPASATATPSTAGTSAASTGATPHASSSAAAATNTTG